MSPLEYLRLLQSSSSLESHFRLPYTCAVPVSYSQHCDISPLVEVNLLGPWSRQYLESRDFLELAYRSARL